MSRVPNYVPPPSSPSRAPSEFPTMPARIHLSPYILYTYLLAFVSSFSFACSVDKTIPRRSTTLGNFLTQLKDRRERKSVLSFLSVCPKNEAHDFDSVAKTRTGPERCRWPIDLRTCLLVIRSFKTREDDDSEQKGVPDEKDVVEFSLDNAKDSRFNAQVA